MQQEKFSTESQQHDEKIIVKIVGNTQKHEKCSTLFEQVKGHK